MITSDHLLASSDIWKAGLLQDDQPTPAYVASQTNQDECVILQELAGQLHLPYTPTIDASQVSLEHIKLLPLPLVKRAATLPLGLDAANHMRVACADPFRLALHHDLARILGHPLSLTLTPSGPLLQAINAAYTKIQTNAAEVLETIEDDSLDSLANAITIQQDLLETQDDAPVIRLVNALLSQAAKQRASDIHIEPYETSLAARLRIDGVLATVLTPPKRLQDAIIARVKIMAGLDIAEKRRPQDGRIGLRIAGRSIDFRVSSVPTQHGERLVLRLLDTKGSLRTLEDIGMAGQDLVNFVSLIEQPHGIVLVTGPTGSGKTTTLYAGLSRLRSEDTNILTIEDPVEYQMDGIGQTQVNTKIDLTFASALRAFLRQDPDILMVGEIRDQETAQIAVQASMTGHLVLSTLHTNDAPSALTRLMDMDIEPFLITSTLTGVLAQRLVRTICSHCSEPAQPSAAELAQLGASEELKGAFRRGAGCDRCFKTGYQGRRGIFELLTMNDPLRVMVNRRSDATQLKRLALEHGMTTLRQSGLALVCAGKTTVAEVLRVTQDTDLAEL